MTFCSRCGTSIGAGVQFCPRCGTGILGASDAVATAPIAVTDPGGDALLSALRKATLGEYEILTELGRGGMATVYLAHDLPLDRKVAIKVLAPALLLMGEGMVERFKREARTAAALSHPHIIPIYAVKQDDNILYFVMKHVQGRALDAVIQDVGPLPIKMVQTILAQVGDALAYAHRHGVIHRDIKSANIMIDDEGSAVVTDFGIAKVEQAQGLTVTGVTVGTPAYMSPEQCATCEVTGASDQYSLGVVAYEMLTGHLPFKSESSMSVMYAHYNATARPVSELRRDCPPNLAAAVMQMLEKEPEDRWPTMDDVVAVCGRPSLQRDDPVRNEMITIAKARPARRLPEINVPTSPVALAKSRRRPRARPSRTPRWWLIAGAFGIGAFLLWTAPWRLSREARTAAGDSGSIPLQATPIRAETTALRTRPDSSAVAPRGRPAPREVVVRTAPVQRQDDSVLTALRTTAVSAMRRAAGAGAAPVDLARGDTALRSADSLAAAGRLSEAMPQLATATALWNEAERVARARVVRDTTPTRAAPAPPPVPPAAVVQPPADPRVAIESAIAAYGRALETRDTVQVRRAYPGLTPAQQRGWGDLFGAARRLTVSFTVTALTVSGTSGEATVSGVYEYEAAATGRVERRPASFRATLVSDAASWRLTAIH